MKIISFILLAIFLNISPCLYTNIEGKFVINLNDQRYTQDTIFSTSSNEENLEEIAGCVLPQFTRFTFTEFKMGTYFTIILYAHNETLATIAAKESYEKMDELNKILSDYIEESEINQLSAGSGKEKFVKTSNPLFEVIEKSLDISEKSNGAFDITVGPYVKLWRRAIRQQKLPSVDALNSAKAAVGYKNIILNKYKEKIKLLVPGMQLDVGGIAKGYILDEAMKVLKDNGIESALIDGGGDILVSQPPPDKEAWVLELNTGIGLPEQKKYIKINNASVATSGDTYRFVDFEGNRYSHIIDPKTGLGIIDQFTVSVIAKDGATADGLASAISILGPEEGIKMTDMYEGAAAFIFSGESKEKNSWQSENFYSFVATDEMGAD